MVQGEVKSRKKVIMQFYYTYILLSLKDNKFYVGSTNNVERRFREHEAGANTSTANRRPFKLIFFEAFLNKQDAERRELYFKTTKGKTTLRQMLRENLKELM